MNSDMKTKKLVTATTSAELPATFNSRLGGELIELFLAHLGSDFSISGGEVRKFGAQYLQILLAAQATWRAEGYILTIWPMSDELTAGLTLLGISPDLLSHQKDCMA
ncbi:MAG TPA: STAS domain-containing protein [Acidocella sp.]|nr:STAS domain-containing protein [Acidocella sp.]